MFKANQWLSDQLPFVVYRCPNDNALRGVFQIDTYLNKADNFKNPGFVFAPFKTDGEKILITGEYSKGEMGKLQIMDQESTVEFSEDGKDVHLKLIKNAIAEIEKGKLRKVVLSRFINTSTSQNAAQIFTSLLAKYPLAFCYWWYHPKIGMWLGATPEQFLQYQNGQIFTTSLAGTLPYKDGEKPNWTSKEKEEQQMVTDYIVESLEEKVTDLEVSGPKTQKAGKLWHLKSTIKGRLPSLDDLTDIVKNLHPTPAVCGLPKKASLDYILRNEAHDREFYTGYLGPINLDDNGQINLFVNLRCFRYSSGNAKVFIGGGITAGSSPENEWEETQFKSSTILEVL